MAARYSCAVCKIAYYVPANVKSNACPLCDAEELVATLREALRESNASLAHATDLINQLQAEVDIVRAIKEAIALLDKNDLMFFKTWLYQWKIDRSVAMKVIHGGKGRARGRAKGFMVMPRGADPVAHHCTSFGGRAIAEYFDEAAGAHGSAQAMILLIRAFALHLPGASS